MSYRVQVVEFGETPLDGWSVGWDVSDWQAPGRIDWQAAEPMGGWALAKLSEGGRVSKSGQRHLIDIRSSKLIPGGYHFTDDAPAEVQAATFLGELAKGAKVGDSVPWIDCEEIIDGGKPRMPRNVRSYCAAVDALIDGCLTQWGGVGIYSNMRFWRDCGSPGSWLACPWWWVPWYPGRKQRDPKARMSLDEAWFHQWPARPGVPRPAMWQFDSNLFPWSKCGEIDENLARCLPCIAEG